MTTPTPTGPAQEEPRRFSSFGCGCGIAIAVVLAVLVGVSWYAYIQGKHFQDSLRDPAARDARSREILGYRELPAGYHAMGGFKVPFVMEMAMLSDRDPAPGEAVSGAQDAFRTHGFVFMRTRAGDDERRKLDEYFAGKVQETDFFTQTDLHFELEERLGRGEITLDPATVDYVTERVRMDLGETQRREILAQLLVRCPDSDRLRVALWFEPDPETEAGPEAGTENESAAESEAGAASLAGSPADPAAIKAFLSHFDLCR